MSWSAISKIVLVAGGSFAAIRNDGRLQFQMGRVVLATAITTGVTMLRLVNIGARRGVLSLSALPDPFCVGEQDRFGV